MTMRESTILALPFTIVCVLSFLAQHYCFVEGTEPDVEAAVKGLTKKTRFARGLQDQCIDVYEDLEQRARKAGTDFLHNDISNWHHVKNQDKRFDMITNELEKQENEFTKKYENDVIGLSENLQLLEPIKEKKREILAFQSVLTTKILELNDLASKVARVKFYTEIKFLAKTHVPCLKAIHTQWENANAELKDSDGGESKSELKEKTESKAQVAKKYVEDALQDYEKKIIDFFEKSQAVPELKIKLKDAGFNSDGSMNERRLRMKKK